MFSANLRTNLLLLIVAILTTSPFVGSRVSAGRANQSSIPQSVVGDWKWGTISPNEFWDDTTGRYLGNARTIGAFFTFGPDGTYKQYIYVSMRNYGWATTSWTYHEGTVEFDQQHGTFKLHPSKGRYRASDNRVQKNNFDRQISNDELKTHAKTYLWKFETNEYNKTYLKIGETPETLSSFEKWQSEAAK